VRSRHDLAPGRSDHGVAGNRQPLIADPIQLELLPRAVAGVPVGLDDHAQITPDEIDADRS
jgi:hypothetical protein